MNLHILALIKLTEHILKDMPWCILSAYYDLLMKLKYAGYPVREIKIETLQNIEFRIKRTKIIKEKHFSLNQASN